jgi:hypothetical protein
VPVAAAEQLHGVAAGGDLVTLAEHPAFLSGNRCGGGQVSLLSHHVAPFDLVPL